MQKVFLFLLLFLLPLAEVPNHAPASEPVSVASTPETDEIDQLFDDMQLDGIVSYTAFRQAVTGYQKIEQKSKSIMTLIDFSKPSTEKRLYVLDMKNKKLLYTSVVSHGKNSGGNYATSFSNKNGSYKSSLGFYLTENTYQGRNGYSLVLNGLEKGINDQAKQRAIVMHGALYLRQQQGLSGQQHLPVSTANGVSFMGAACQLKILSYLCGKGIFILTKTIMKKFTCVQDIGDLKSALAESFEIKKDRFKYVELGRNKTLLMIFFNSSLRTRLSTQKAALNLGMNVIVLDINQGAWKLETERGVIMDGDKPEHLLEAIPVMGCYCDIIGVRSFARFENREYDYNEVIINQFIQHSGRPVFSMEAATRHPLQSFADLITIEEYKKTARPKVVMTWAPHPRPLPQAVPNSFAEWMNATDYEFVITHPEGYELDPKFVGNARVEYDQMKAFEGADFIYAKNWAAYTGDNYGQILSTDRNWTVGDRQMAVTNNAYFMHCLPVRRNMIVTDDVIESPQSIVIPEAANREISATVVLKRLLENLP